MLRFSKGQSAKRSASQAYGDDLPVNQQALTFISFVALGLINACNAANSPEKVASTDTGSKTNTEDPTVTPVYAAQVANLDYQLSGTVVDVTSNQPITSATVKFMGQTTLSDTKGAWAFNLTATDCTLLNACQVTVTPQTGTNYQAATQQLVDTDTSAQKFVSMGNVIKLNTTSTPIPPYMVQPVTPVYAARAPGSN